MPRARLCTVGASSPSTRSLFSICHWSAPGEDRGPAPGVGGCLSAPHSPVLLQSGRGERCSVLPIPGHRVSACTTSRGHAGTPPLTTSRVPFLQIPFLQVPTCLMNPQTDAGGYWSHRKGWTGHTKESPRVLLPPAGYGRKGSAVPQGSGTEFRGGSPALPKQQDMCRHPDN